MGVTGKCVLAALLWTVAAVAAGAAPESAAVVVDDFENVSAWAAYPADGVDLKIGADAGAHGGALRLDFRFSGGGYAVAHKAIPLDLPENYAFRFRLRGQSPPNNLEFKLIDSTGSNVWWMVRRNLDFPADWQRFTIKKRQIQFAWGPQGGGDIRHVAAIEFAVTAGSGGTGTVWIDDLELQPLPLPEAVPPRIAATASSARPGHGAPAAVDGDSSTSWWSNRRDISPWLMLDLGEIREFGGLTIHWLPGRHAGEYSIDISSDGSSWSALRSVHAGNGGRDDLFLPESEARYVNLHVRRAAGGDGAGIADLDLRPLEWSATRETFFQNVARESPRGSYPRGLSGEQLYWTVAGLDADEREVLFDEDGRIETGQGRFSIEPFLFADGKLVGWSDVRSEQSLEDGCLPIPTVTWQDAPLGLEIKACATGRPGASSILVRYRIRNDGARRRRATLYLALRPFQVNPPSQWLNVTGGTAPVRDIALENRGVRVNGERAVIPLVRPVRFGAATFDEGDIVADYLRTGELPAHTRVADDFAAASAALAWPLDLAPGARRDIELLVPLYPETPAGSASRTPAHPFGGDRNEGAVRDWVESRFDSARTFWRARLGRVEIQLPEAAQPIVETVRAQLGYIFVDRAGPALQPGARSYARSWIRDGALTCSALLRLGLDEPVREFIEWFAPHQYANGKIPCVVDARGADPVPEHDSSGEFVFLVAEHYRYTRDRALLERMYPRVLKAVAYLDSLRHERLGPEFQAAGKREFYGILPPSISHEGYSAKPMHSYWDDFFALRGFADAAFLAGELGREADRQRLAALHDEFQRDLVASIDAAMRRHGIDYIPGCADLGDFDATSTTIALSPVGAGPILPQPALQRTFEKYWEFFRARRDGAPWKDFTPYEVRTIGAFVHLGWRERAQELVSFFMQYQRPPGWRQWPEVVWPELRSPRFLGDLPHTWVGSDFVRSVLDMLAYAREADDALVIGAGVPADWLAGTGLVVRGLRTPYGLLGYTMRRDGNAIEVHVDAGLRVPRGGIVIAAPTAQPVREAIVNGTAVQGSGSTPIVVHDLPATIRLRF